jgi:uncharacterized protein (TIRG00374 family)
MRPKILKSIKIIVALLLLIFLFSKIDLNKLRLILATAKVYPIVISALLFYLGVYVSVLRWKQSLWNFNIKVSTIKLYSIYCISSFFNNFLPSSIGGDVYKIIVLNKKFPKQNKVILGSIIQDRAMGFITLFIVNIFIAIFFLNIIYSNTSFLILEIIILIGTILVFTLYIFKNKLKSSVSNITNLKILHKIISTITYLSKFQSKTIFIQSLLLSLVFILLVGYAKFLTFNAFGIDINLGYIILISTVTQISSILPISLNSIGITEGLNMFLYSLIGIPPEISLTVTLIGRVSMMITSAIGGVFYFFKDKIYY